MKITKITETIETIKKEYESCTLCPMQCRVNRLQGERGGCGVGRNSKVFNTTVLVNENEEITPTYAIYFGGCCLDCCFCSVKEENAAIKAMDYCDRQNDYRDVQLFDADEKFIKRVEREIEETKPKTVSFIGGEPSVHLLTIFELIEKLRPQMPLVFFTNSYYSRRINRILDEWFEYVVTDIHYGNHECSRMIANSTNDYFEAVTRNILAIKDKLILRHLLLPGHLDCCYKRIIDWMSTKIPDKPLWLLTNYFPYGNTRITADNNTDGHGLNRRVSVAEIAEALDYAREKGVEVKTLDLLSKRPEAHEGTYLTQKIVIDGDGTVAFKYGDAIAVEMARILTTCNSERSSVVK